MKQDKKTSKPFKLSEKKSLLKTALKQKRKKKHVHVRPPKFCNKKNLFLKSTLKQKKTKKNNVQVMKALEILK